MKRAQECEWGRLPQSNCMDPGDGEPIWTWIATVCGAFGDYGRRQQDSCLNSNAFDYGVCLCYVQNAARHETILEWLENKRSNNVLRDKMGGIPNYRQIEELMNDHKILEDEWRKGF